MVSVTRVSCIDLWSEWRTRESCHQRFSRVSPAPESLVRLGLCDKSLCYTCKEKSILQISGRSGGRESLVKGCAVKRHVVWGVGEKEVCCGRNARLLVNASDVMSFLDDFNCQRKMSGRSQGGEDT